MTCDITSCYMPSLHAFQKDLWRLFITLALTCNFFLCFPRQLLDILTFLGHFYIPAFHTNTEVPEADLPRLSGYTQPNGQLTQHRTGLHDSYALMSKRLSFHELHVIRLLDTRLSVARMSPVPK